MTPSEYESFLADLYKQLVAKTSIHIDVFLHKKFLGLSGQTYDIDLGFEFEIAEVKYLTLIEAKYYSNCVEVGEILEFSAKLSDINANKGIFITKVGFQAGALRIANSRKIALVIYNPGIDDRHRTILEKSHNYSIVKNPTLASIILLEIEHLISTVNNRDSNE